ncbi:MAG: hypothetical protein NTZ05_14565 [Chloroflexi bacterium]|nr:hypothetical protein [Chloroflexota bacterium]
MRCALGPGACVAASPLGENSVAAPIVLAPTVWVLLRKAALDGRALMLKPIVHISANCNANNTRKGA